MGTKNKFGFAPRYVFEDIRFCDEEELKHADYDKEVVNSIEPGELYVVDLDVTMEVLGEDFACSFEDVDYKFYDFVDDVCLEGMYLDLLAQNPKYTLWFDYKLFFDETNAKKIHDMLPDLIEEYKPKVIETYKNRIRERLRIFEEAEMKKFGKVVEPSDYDVERCQKEWVKYA